MSSEKPDADVVESEGLVNPPEGLRDLPPDDDPDVSPIMPMLPRGSFPVVGIGASAGGLAAFEAFFSGMAPDTTTGMAYVLVQHLAPDHKSMLSELVGRYTRMEVCEVEDGMVVRPDCAYIIPPNRDMAFLNGALHLLEPAAPRGMRSPIDFFFSSLAQDQHDRAIGIVLSGTGSDGTAGVRAIKAEGGMVIAQSPESTDHDGMPRAAIATGLVDFVLPPAEMASRISAYVAHAFGAGRPSPRTIEPVPDDVLNKVLLLLRGQTGHDFSQYKRNTITRRVGRRMALHQVERMDEYLRYVRQTPAELMSLFRDLLIGVTSFFRDPEAFAVVEKDIIPRIFDAKPAGSTVRVWVPGCSTGEEAYSLAMLLQERMTALRQIYKIQVFATDIDSQAILHARAGAYPSSVAASVPQERLARHFIQDPEGGTYRVHKVIRDLLVFSEQDVIKDPPFSRLDLISCRNLLIYMSGALQKRLIAAFHFALNPGGSLLLGTSESVGEVAELFAPIDRKWRVYQRKDGTLAAQRAAMQRFPLAALPGEGLPRPVVAEQSLQSRELAERTLREHYGVVSALVDSSGDILYLDGRTGRYLEPAPGDASLNMLKMAREGLRKDLQAALHQAALSGQPAYHPNVRVKTNGDYTAINLTVRPTMAGVTAGSQRVLFLVILEEVRGGRRAAPDHDLLLASAGTDDGESDLRVSALRQELRAKEEFLQATNEELETSNEELRSANEEMQSINEELQSTNEELETSREELQSVNEELATVNTELQNRVADLSRANNDMNNLLAGMDVGTIFVDHQLRIQRFTPAVTQVINLIPTDIGRPVGHIASNLAGYDRLVEDVRSVLSSLVPKEVEVKSRAGVWYLLRIRPYRTLENTIEGVVITFFEVSELKNALRAVQDADVHRALASVVRDSHDAVTVQDLNGRVLVWSAGAERIYGWTEEEAKAMNLSDRLPETRRENELNTIRQRSEAGELASYQTERLTKDGQALSVWVAASPLLNAEGKIYAIATTERACSLAAHGPVSEGGFGVQQR